jgi:uncharacterized protein with ATP-grasp and redox domains
MKASVHCRPCLEKLVYQAAENATPDPGIRKEAIEEGLAVLNSAFSLDKAATEIATECHRAIKRRTGNDDIYREMKIAEMEMAERLFQEVRSLYGDDLRSCMRLATLGNSIDFFKDTATVMENMRGTVDFAVDQIDELEEKLANAALALYLADNAGECFFDLTLLKKMRERTRVVYVVKGFPVQNDITLEDLAKAGLMGQMGEVATNGSDAVGIDLASSSEEFRSLFEAADLVFAKGMGNYETLSEIPAQGRTFHCLMAKCQPIADSMGVPLDGYVAMLR